MPVLVMCPKCRASFSVPDQARGRSLRCAQCRESFKAETGLQGSQDKGTPAPGIPSPFPGMGAGRESRPPIGKVALASKADRKHSPVFVPLVTGISAAAVLGLFGLAGIVVWSLLHPSPNNAANPPRLAAASFKPAVDEKPAADKKEPDKSGTETSTADKNPQDRQPSDLIGNPTIPTELLPLVATSKLEPDPKAQPNVEATPDLKAQPNVEPKPTPRSDADAWKLRKSELTGFKLYAPDGKSFLVNKDDDKGIMQIYIGENGSEKLTCITSTQRPGGPKADRLKMQPSWHPSGKWIFLAAERDHYTPPPILGNDRKFVEGMLQCGLWTNMYAVSPDGMKWHRLTDFKSNAPGTPDGFTGVPFTSDGKKAVWSQVVDGNILAYYPFGKWELMVADFEERNGIPRLTNPRNITPKGMHWNEPGNFHPDKESLLLTGSDEKDAQSMNQYILNIRTGKLTNLTKTKGVWNEHGVFSPDGEKIIFMSSYPYRDDPKSNKVLSVKTEFMLMNKDGTGLTQLTHFYEKGFPEYSEKGGMAACPCWSPDGRSAMLSRLFFPKYEYWEIVFQGKKSTRNGQ
jgi:predicted Zn finger-like uncharacterized protein